MLRVVKVFLLALMPWVVSASSDGLVAWWKFDGNAKDATDNHLDGTVCGATLTTDRFGHRKSAYKFEHGTFIMIPNSPLLQNLCKEISISAWIRPTGRDYGTEIIPIVCKGFPRPISRNIGLSFFDNCFEIASCGVVQMRKNPFMNIWQHILCSANEDGTELYINGELVGCSAVGLKAYVNDAPLKIGSDDVGSVEYYHGDMDDVRIYDRALTAEDAKRLYRGMNPRNAKREAEKQVVESEHQVEEIVSEESEAGELDDEKTVTESVVLAVPEKAAIERAIKSINELCADDVKAFKAGRLTNAAFAKKLLAYSKMTDDTTVKFVLYQNAFLQLVIGSEWRLARNLFDKVMEKYGPRFASAVTDKAAKALEKKANNYKTAKMAKALSARCSEVKTSLAAIDAAENGLRNTPSSRELRNSKAVNCIKLGDWESALAIYAEEADTRRGEIARWERAATAERSDKLTAVLVGDYWWERIDEKKGRCLFNESVSRHVIFWYREALDGGDMSELKAELIKKRIARLENEYQIVPNISRGGATGSGPDKYEKPEISTDETVEAESKEIILIPTSDVNPTAWKYCTTSPSGNWMSILYNDRNWYDGKSTFFVHETRGSKGTIWSTRDIYMRKEFVCDKNPKSIDTASLKYCVDDDIEIWLNGVKVFASGITREYQEIKPMKAIVAKLRCGKNVLAVHAVNGGGPGWIDVGLSIKVK